MTPDINLSVNLTPDIRLEQALQSVVGKKHNSIKKLTVVGTFTQEDFLYIQTKMNKDLQVLNISGTCIENDNHLNNNEKTTSIRKLRETLFRFFPENALDEVLLMLKKYPIHIRITKPRSSIFGTYIHSSCRDYHIITINGNLNGYEFLSVFLHEYAHLLVQVNCDYYTRPHGIEWKNYCRGLFHHFIQKRLFPNEICMAIKCLMVNMPAKSTSTISYVLEKYGSRKDFKNKCEYCCH